MKKNFLSGFLLAFLFLVSGCAVSNLEELSTLKAMGSEDKAKDKVLSREDKNFQKLQEAIRGEQIKAGVSTTEAARNWGEPVIVSHEGKQDRWAYKGKGDWFKAEKIYLYFSAEDRRLERWECHPTACSSEGPS